MRIAAGAFKAKCLKLMDRVKATHEEVVISKRGEPIARLVPMGQSVAEERIFGMLSGTAQLRDDLIAPTGEAWHAAE
jgi:prevent-host-death family protein